MWKHVFFVPLFLLWENLGNVYRKRTRAITKQLLIFWFFLEREFRTISSYMDIIQKPNNKTFYSKKSFLIVYAEKVKQSIV